MAVTETDIGSEKEGREKYKEAESDGDGVTETKVCYVVMSGAGNGREWWRGWWW